MRQEEYLRKFMEELDDFSQEDKEQIREYFQEMICDRLEAGETEEEILKNIGSPEAAAKKLRSEYTVRMEADDPRVDSSQNYGKEKQSRAEYGVFCSGKEAQELQFLRVQAENIKIQVNTVKGNTVRVLFEPREGVDEIRTSEENGGFTFQQKIRKLWFFDLLQFGRSCCITVELPESFCGSVELITKNAKIELENTGMLESLKAKTSNSHINMSRVQAGRIWLETSNGKISVSGAVGGDFHAKSSNGHIVLEEGDFTENIEIRTSNAAIEVPGISGRNITLQTSNGAVRGKVQGNISDYDIESRTSNAGSTLPTDMRSGKGRRLKVFTSNGKISIDFARNA